MTFIDDTMNWSQIAQIPGRRQSVWYDYREIALINMNILLVTLTVCFGFCLIWIPLTHEIDRSNSQMRNQKHQILIVYLRGYSKIKELQAEKW